MFVTLGCVSLEALCACAWLLQRTVERGEERSDLQPEVPIDFYSLDFANEFVKIDFHHFHLLVGGADVISRLSTCIVS